MNKTQSVGLLIIGLSLFTYLGGPAVVGGLFNISFMGMKLRITVLCGDTGKPLEGAVVTVTGLDWQDTGTHVDLCFDLAPTDSEGLVGTSINTWGTVYLSVSAPGYLTRSGTMAAGEAETAYKTFQLTAETIDDDPVEDPEETVDDPVEEEPVDETVDDSGMDPVEEPVEAPVDVSTPVARTLQTYSMFTGALGAGLTLLGTVQEEEN